MILRYFNRKLQSTLSSGNDKADASADWVQNVEISQWQDCYPKDPITS